MPFYEHVFIGRQDLSEAQARGLMRDFAEILSSGGGELVREEYWGARALAYPIRKNRRGHYVMFHINSPHVAVAEMERKMRISSDILRFLTFKVESLSDGDSIMIRDPAGYTNRRRDIVASRGQRPRAGVRHGGGASHFAARDAAVADDVHAGTGSEVVGDSSA